MEAKAQTNKDLYIEFSAEIEYLQNIRDITAKEVPNISATQLAMKKGLWQNTGQHWNMAGFGKNNKS